MAKKDGGESGDRRYSEAEFALILRRAIEMDAPKPRIASDALPPQLPPEGLTLSEIQEIASEVGVDPARVLDAADSLAIQRWSRIARVFGGPAKMDSERELGRRLGPRELALLMDVTRTVFDTPGESHEVLGGVEWKNGSKVSEVSVRVAPSPSGAKVNVSINRALEGFLSHYVPIMWGTAIIAIPVAIIDPGIWQLTAASLIGGALAGYGVGRTIWRKSTEKWAGLLNRVTSEMWTALRESPPEGQPESEGQGVVGGQNPIRPEIISVSPGEME